MKKITITGMNCGHCVARVKRLFEDIEEVKSVEVNLEKSYILLNSILRNDEIVNLLGDKYFVVSITEEI